MTRERSMTPGTDQGTGALERGRALLAIGRTADALEIAVSLTAANPDDHTAHVFVGDCMLALGRWPEAERASGRATELAPDDPESAILSVRCAENGAADVMWRRVQRLQHVDSVSFRARYWAAIGAAVSGREDVALGVIARMEADFVGSNEVLYAAAEVDLALSRRHRHGRATIAAQNAETLLGIDPLDPRAHRLRQRASETFRAGTSRRDFAREQIRIANQATAAGVLPPAGRLHNLTIEAVGPVGVGLVFFVLGFTMAAAVDGGLGWQAGVAVVAVLWSAAIFVVQRRLSRVAALLPELGRPRLLMPFARSFRVAAVLLAVMALIGLGVLFPYDTERAVSLGMSSEKARTEERVVYTDVPVSADGSVPDFTMPSVVTVQIPEKPDPVGGVRLLRYYSGVSVTALAMAVVLALRARSMIRPSRKPMREP